LLTLCNHHSKMRIHAPIRGNSIPLKGRLYDIITACHNYLTDLTVNPIQVNLARHVF